MSDDERASARNVSMYDRQWAVVDQLAGQIAKLTGSSKENASAALRRIVDEYAERQPQLVAAGK